MMTRGDSKERTFQAARVDKHGLSADVIKGVVWEDLGRAEAHTVKNNIGLEIFDFIERLNWGVFKHYSAVH